MDDINNKGTQNGADQTGANNSGTNNTQNTQQNQNNQQNGNVQQQNNQSIGGTGAATFTQEQVNRMMTNEKNQGRAAAFREMGIDPNDPNTANMMNMFKAFMASMQSPEQQIQNQVAQQQIKIVEAESRAKKAEVKAEAMQLGVLSQYVDDVVVIIMSKLDDKTDVKSVVRELKTKYPVWFNIDNNQNNGGTQNQSQNNNAGQNGTGSSVGNVSGNGGQNSNITGIGARLAASRKSSNKKSSFWD